MEFLIASTTPPLAIGLVTSSTEKANAEVYCQYFHYRADYVARSGAALRPRRVAGAAREQ
jgi:hypothetical protein